MKLVVLLQHDLVDRLTTRLVAPLIPVDEQFAIDDGVVMVEVAGSRYAAAIQLLSAVSVRELGPVVANLERDQAAFKRAIDLLVLGI